MSVQRLPGTPAATTASTVAATGASERDAARLVRLWVVLAARVAAAAAHDLPGAQLLRHLTGVEDAIQDRHPMLFARMAELWVWQAGLLHDGTGPVAGCLIGRRALIDLPVDLEGSK